MPTIEDWLHISELCLIEGKRKRDEEKQIRGKIREEIRKHNLQPGLDQKVGMSRPKETVKRRRNPGRGFCDLPIIPFEQEHFSPQYALNNLVLGELPLLKYRHFDTHVHFSHRRLILDRSWWDIATLPRHLIDNWGGRKESNSGSGSGSGSGPYIDSFFLQRGGIRAACVKNAQLNAGNGKILSFNNWNKLKQQLPQKPKKKQNSPPSPPPEKKCMFMNGKQIIRWDGSDTGRTYSCSGVLKARGNRRYAPWLYDVVGGNNYKTPWRVRQLFEQTKQANDFLTENNKFGIYVCEECAGRFQGLYPTHFALPITLDEFQVVDFELSLIHI